jgi:MerR family transcriptional regulator, light-induced transcriptional regulator
MASLARVEDKIGTRRASSPAQRQRSDSRGLADFRALATADPELSLSRLIESEIIPRLMVAHAGEMPATFSQDIVAGEVAALAPLALQVEADALLAHVEAIMMRGVTLDTLMVDLLAPTARLLGDLWESDRLDFVDVTMALWRLQEVVHELAARSQIDRACPHAARRALFATMPGDQHSFGALVVDEVFRRGGWATDRMCAPQAAELVGRVGRDWFDMVGLTVSCDAHIAPLRSVIVALRNVSRNPGLFIMVGGQVFSTDPQLAVRIGADGTAGDARRALKVADDLVRVHEGEGR